MGYSVPIILNDVMLSIFKLSVLTQSFNVSSVMMLSVDEFSVIMLSVVIPVVTAPQQLQQWPAAFLQNDKTLKLLGETKTII